MSFNVTEIQSTIGKLGVLKSSHFETVITFPNGVIDRELTARIDSAELPGRSIQTSNVKYYGVPSRVGYDVTYPEIGVTMICSESMREKLLMTQWQDLIINRHARPDAAPYQYDLGYYDDYVGRVQILQYSPNRVLIYKMTLIEAYPVQVNSMPVNWGSEEIHKLNVSFAYKYWIEN